MPKNIFLQTVIAIIWDFDQTLTPNYMQEPLFRHFKIDSDEFWKEANKLPDFYKSNGLEKIESDTVYLNHILTYVQKGIFKGLNNELLKDLGKQIEFYPGLPEFFPKLKKQVGGNHMFSEHEIKIEHYIVSTGLRQMILGSKISEYTEDIWGCEFIETIPEPGFSKRSYPLESDKVITQIGYIIDNTTKTRAIFEINKGTNKMPQIHVNATIAHEDRRVPFQNMVCIADGPSDIPMFSLINHFGGKTFAVYAKGNKKQFNQVNDLQRQDRIESFGEADYTEDSHTSLWITNTVEGIAERIAKDRSKWLENNIKPPPKHIID